MHAIWALILDPKFMEAYQHGVIIKCGDGILRRIFPCFFTYSADYPEKVLLATIRTLGCCPCPHCLVEKSQIAQLGTVIFFLTRFQEFDFNVFDMLVPDVLHEFELRVWKAVLTHLLHILFAIGGDSIQILDHRFHRVPTFGCDTIRRISGNISALKQLAGRDYEDLLQLRLHSDRSIDCLEDATTDLGKSLRKFVSTVCEAYDMRELPKETAARGRQRAKLANKGNQRKGVGDSSSGKKSFNLSTYKIHSLGHYPRFIRLFGPTNNYNTQIGEPEHK
ncbi:hypothetical protein K435DRAFT_821626 [Dendrothele bispora CBS 962.96]|uniref:Uncharacterized protein n=1 Tax=Dendrothele bispora (strain CBS 962.96) TaxID=1314807 RepID=A0A4V4HDU5_DENBC|nr:hypothetical protein K435DRAFT_821626 [Dendrothele bispora CBS 962.96]